MCFPSEQVGCVQDGCMLAHMWMQVNICAHACDDAHMEARRGCRVSSSISIYPHETGSLTEPGSRLADSKS